MVSDGASVVTEAVILCAGKGERLGSIGRSSQKCVQMFRGSPLVLWLVRYLRECRVRKIYVVVGHEHESVERAFEHYSTEVNLIYDELVVGTASSLSLTAPLIRNNRFLFFEGDIYLPTKDVKRLVDLSRTKNLVTLYSSNFLRAPSHRLVEKDVGNGRVRSDEPTSLSLGRLCGAWVMNRAVFDILHLHKDVAGCIERVDELNNHVFCVECSDGYRHFATMEDFEGF